MSKMQVGDTVTFRREVARKCNAPDMAGFRATVTGVAGEWLFMQAASGEQRVMPARHMCKVARNGVVLELVQ